MSDFGATISIQKKDGKAFTDEEENIVREKVREVHESNQFKDGLGEPYSFITGITEYLGDPDFYEMNVLLSDYWGNSDDFKAYQAQDLKQATVIANLLGLLLGEHYVLKETFEWW